MVTDILADPLTGKLALAVITGIIISGLAALSSDAKWGWKKFLYTLGLAGISGLVVVDASNGVTGENAISLFLEIIGASYIGNKLLGVADKLKGLR